MTSCDFRDWGCHGGNLKFAAQFLAEEGLPEEKYFPYMGQQPIPCSNTRPGWEKTIHKVANWGSINSVDEFKQEIMEGPVACYITPYSDFLYYKGGAYQPIMGAKYIHAVTLCGWDDTKKCWLFKNSWGTDWGDGGFGWSSTEWKKLLVRGTRYG